MRDGKLWRGREVIAIGTNRGQWWIRTEVTGEAVAQAERSCKRRHRPAGSQYPDRRKRDIGRHDSHRCKRVIGRKRATRERQHLAHLLGKLLAIEWPQRTRGCRIGA